MFTIVVFLYVSTATCLLYLVQRKAKTLPTEYSKLVGAEGQHGERDRTTEGDRQQVSLTQTEWSLLFYRCFCFV